MNKYPFEPTVIVALPFTCFVCSVSKCWLPYWHVRNGNAPHLTLQGLINNSKQRKTFAQKGHTKNRTRHSGLILCLTCAQELHADS